MSRSIRKNFFLQHVCCNSEKKDKKIWHKTFRTREKQNLTVSSLEEHITVHHREVSNPWNMGKDGKERWSENRILKITKRYANHYGKNKKERLALEKKFYYRLVSK